MSDPQGWLFANEELPSTNARKPLVFKTIGTPLWTENKAKLIAKYLFYFVLITKHGSYIDGFAAQQNEDSESEGWAAKLVLESNPKLLRDFWLCDASPKGAEMLRDLADAQPPLRQRRIDVLEGDFNALVAGILASGRIGPKTAAFCLVDQRTFECDWATVEALARHKEQNKIEVFYFLGTGWLERAFDATKVSHERIEKWWGSPDWERARNMHGETRAQFFAQRFRDLGYSHAYAWPIRRRGPHGRIMYHMIHATDHPEAPKLMARAYRNVNRPNEDEQLELPALGAPVPDPTR